MPGWDINFGGAHVDLSDPTLLRLVASIEAHAGLLDQIPHLEVTSGAWVASPTDDLSTTPLMRLQA